MTLTIDAKTGKIQGGTLLSRITLKKLCYTSSLFRSLKLRGFWRVARIFAKLGGIKERVWVDLEGEVTLSVDINDPYWNCLIDPCFVYEPELHHVLELLKDVDYAFLDCGANMGYWSCFVSSRRYGEKQAIAIEALEGNYKLLEANNERNGKLFKSVHRALSNFNDQTLELYMPPSGHASVSLMKDATVSGDTHVEMVQTITIDEVAKQFSIEKPLLIKLDVEGVEIDALKGAISVLEQLPLVVYEDHGDDQKSEVTKFIMDELDMQVWFIHDDGSIEIIDSLDTLKYIKVDKMKGYNFVACHTNSPFRSYFRQ